VAAAVQRAVRKQWQMTWSSIFECGWGSLKFRASKSHTTKGVVLDKLLGKVVTINIVLLGILVRLHLGSLSWWHLTWRYC